MPRKRPQKERPRPLKGGIPRAFPSHATREAYDYRLAVQGLRRRYVGLPPEADRWVREAALIATELERVAADAALARERGQVRKPGALSKHAVRLRSQLMAIEDRLAAMVPPVKKPTIAETFGFKD